MIDGGPWIIRQIHHRGLKTTAIGLDFFYLSENVHKTRKIAFGEANEEKSDPGSKWAADLLHAAKHTGYEAMESQCRVILDRVKGPGKRWDADNAEAIMALEALHQSDQSAAYRQLAMCGRN